MDAADRERIEADLRELEHDAERDLQLQSAWVADVARRALSQLSALSEALSAAQGVVELRGRSIAKLQDERFEQIGRIRLHIEEVVLARRERDAALVERNTASEALTACQQERGEWESAYRLQEVATESVLERYLLRARKAEADLTACRAQGEAMQAQYYELLFGVVRVWPGETRHQTALRYIQQAEKPSGEARAALSSTPTEPKNES